nr:hypothetical protein [Caldanaerobacter subterraneus]
MQKIKDIPLWDKKTFIMLKKGLFFTTIS